VPDLQSVIPFVSHICIGQLERGEKNATIESIEKVCKALALPFEVLFENIVTGDTKNDVAKECYCLITLRPEKEQKAILELIKKTDRV